MSEYNRDQHQQLRELIAGSIGSEHIIIQQHVREMLAEANRYNRLTIQELRELITEIDSRTEARLRSVEAAISALLEETRSRINTPETPVQQFSAAPGTVLDSTYDLDVSIIPSVNRSISYSDAESALRERRFRRVEIQESLLILMLLRPQDRPWQLSCNAPSDCLFVNMEADTGREAMFLLTIAHPSFPSLLSLPPEEEIPVYAFTYTTTHVDQEQEPVPDPPVPSQVIVWRQTHEQH